MSQVVTLRRRDLAVRLAIGALPRHIETWLVGKALRLTLAGVLVGVSARWVGRLMRDEAAHSGGGDLFVLGALILAFAPLGIVSCWLPGRQASRIQPAEAWAQPSSG